MVWSTALLLLLPALFPSLLSSPLHSTFIYSQQGAKKHRSYWNYMVKETTTKATTLKRTTDSTAKPQSLIHQHQFTLVLLHQMCPSPLLPCPSFGLLRGIVALEQQKQRLRVH